MPGLPIGAVMHTQHPAGAPSRGESCHRNVLSFNSLVLPWIWLTRATPSNPAGTAMGDLLLRTSWSAV